MAHAAPEVAQYGGGRGSICAVRESCYDEAWAYEGRARWTPSSSRDASRWLRPSRHQDGIPASRFAAASGGLRAKPSPLREGGRDAWWSRTGHGERGAHGEEASRVAKLRQRPGHGIEASRAKMLKLQIVKQGGAAIESVEVDLRQYNTLAKLKSFVVLRDGPAGSRIVRFMWRGQQLGQDAFATLPSRALVQCWVSAAVDEEEAEEEALEEEEEVRTAGNDGRGTSSTAALASAQESLPELSLSALLEEALLQASDLWKNWGASESIKLGLGLACACSSSLAYTAAFC